MVREPGPGRAAHQSDRQDTGRRRRAAQPQRHDAYLGQARAAVHPERVAEVALDESEVRARRDALHRSQAEHRHEIRLAPQDVIPVGLAGSDCGTEGWDEH